MPKHGPPTKKCGDCQRFHPLDDYWKSPRTKDGLRAYCKHCEGKHYKRYSEQMKARTKLAVTEKRCYRCKETKPTDQFHICRAHKDNLANFCVPCAAANHKIWAATHDSPQRRRERLASAMYGITPAQLREMTVRQKNICAICEKDMGRRPCIDHNHLNGHVRELLCNSCNALLAGLERPGFMDKALHYIFKHEEKAKDKMATSTQVEIPLVL